MWGSTDSGTHSGTCLQSVHVTHHSQQCSQVGSPFLQRAEKGVGRGAHLLCSDILARPKGSLGIAPHLKQVGVAQAARAGQPKRGPRLLLLLGSLALQLANDVDGQGALVHQAAATLLRLGLVKTLREPWDLLCGQLLGLAHSLEGVIVDVAGYCLGQEVWQVAWAAPQSDAMLGCCGFQQLRSWHLHASVTAWGA